MSIKLAAATFVVQAVLALSAYCVLLRDVIRVYQQELALLLHHVATSDSTYNGVTQPNRPASLLLDRRDSSHLSAF